MSTKTKQPKSRMRKRIDRVILAAIIITGLLLFNQYYIRSNFREVIDDTVYRSAQPREQQLKDWIKKYHIKTIANFRGPDTEIASKEIAIAEEFGVDLHFIEISAYSPFEGDKLVEFIDILETCKKPILIHCRQGMDRSGTATAIAAWYLGDESYNRAKWYAFVPPGPWKRKAKKDYKHVSDTFDLYEKYCEQNQLDPAEFENFKQWALESCETMAGTETEPESQ